LKKLEEFKDIGEKTEFKIDLENYKLYSTANEILEKLVRFYFLFQI